MTQDKLQENVVKEYVNGRRQTCFEIAMRFGKTRVAILIMKALKMNSVLICYPNLKIKKSWEDEFTKMGWKPVVTYSTYMSLKHHIEAYDGVFLDELQLASVNQLGYVSDVMALNKNVLGLSGTYAQQTQDDLWEICKLGITFRYSVEEAIEAKIISDYSIIVHQFSLNDTTKYLKKTRYKEWMTTERKESDYLTKMVQNSSGASLKFAALNRMRFINKCNSLRRVTKQLIENHERCLLFGADIEFIESFGIPTYHSKSTVNNLQKFIDGEIDKLGLIRIGTTGLTFPNLDTVIIANIDSNSENLLQKAARSLLKDTEHSTIHIVTSIEPYQQKWLMSALADIPKEKIKRIF